MAADEFSKMTTPDHSNPFADSNPATQSGARPADGAENPYTSPREASELVTPEIGLWQDVWLLVAHRDTSFPPFCVRTNEPAQRAFRCRLLWSYPIDFASRSVTFEVGLCEHCIRRYRKFKYWGWGLMVATVVVGLGGGPELPALLAAAIPLFVVGLVLATRPAVSLKLQRGKPPYFWIRGAHPDFLERLPRWTAR